MYNNRSNIPGIDLHDVYLPDLIIQSLSKEDQIEHHKYCYEYWENIDIDLQLRAKLELKKLLTPDELWEIL